MPGRLATPPGFVPRVTHGLGTREERLYLLYSLACQPNQDRDRAEQLLRRGFPSEWKQWRAAQ